ncbi:MAG: hypothetical protein GEU96_08650 [Propionibacteriales bacterium]|nr:hypothetical protein [Propionibacteriales bacterium]
MERRLGRTVHGHAKLVAVAALTAALAVGVPAVASSLTARGPETAPTVSADLTQTPVQGAEEFVKADALVTGAVSCAATTWIPYDSHTRLKGTGSLRWTTNGGLLRCNVSLPDDAVITTFRVTARDTSPADLSCSLWRTALAGTVGEETNLASATSSGTPGTTTFFDHSISSAVVDNEAYGYFAQCFMGKGDALGVFGASIGYEITAGSGSPLTVLNNPEGDRGLSSQR